MKGLFGKNPYNMERMSVSDIHAMGSVVYFIFAEDELLYVGQSKDFKHRALQHRSRFEEEVEMTNDKRFNNIEFTAIAVPPEQLNEVERYYIEKCLPPYNTDGMPREIIRAHRDVWIKKVELAMAQNELKDVIYKYRLGRFKV